MTTIIVAAVAALVAAFAAWVLRGMRAAAVQAAFEARLSAAEQQVAERTAECEALKSAHLRVVEQHRQESERRATAEERSARLSELAAKLEQRDQLLIKQEAKLATLETRLSEQRNAFEEQRKLLEQAQSALSDSFKALSADALKSNNQAFLELAKAALEKFQEGARGDLEARQKAVDQLVKPLKESLEKVDGKLGDIEKARLSSYSALNEQLKSLVETHLPVLRNETANLVKALRQPTTRGRWGELQLKRVVEMAGMLDHCDFLEQENRTTEEGKLRPDLAVKLPGGRNIIVDAKAPVAAYLEAVEATEEATQRLHLGNHAKQVRNHMAALGRKAYWDQFEPSPEFVVMFLPGEVFFSAALQEDPSLIEFGVDEKVIVATPTTLIALLRAVAYGWRQEALAQNAKEIALLGKDLYSRISTLAEHWNKVGERLGRTVEAYNKSTGSLENSVLRSARRLRDLKVSADDAEIEDLQPVETTPRVLQAEEMVVEADEEEA
ncbi:MAG TPA: DNA recombination protein RmuC [Steroidobacteraceae bacterium]|nr:DNA recombination protein RmuC [Steroidobacteraceae bacterium]